MQKEVTAKRGEVDSLCNKYVRCVRFVFFFGRRHGASCSDEVEEIL